jgi:UDP-N-acetylglucosamine--N-acetylmuramyl-(pentapeptide) pyrophosphoryl-undecaprenol N-acetylglucosamine transferase
MAKIGILMTGGGSGGHIYPLLAVRRKLPEDVEVRYFGSPGAYASELRDNQIRVVRITSSKLRRYFSWENGLDFFKFFWGFLEALWKIFWYMPNAAFSTGGPGSLPIILACRFYRVPVVVHESDSIAGRTNYLSARHAHIVELGFEAAKVSLPKTKAVVNVVGNPVRDEILVSHNQDTARELFGFSREFPVLLFIGGSQGATAINDFVLTHLDEFLKKFQIIHQVGNEKFSEYKSSYELLMRDVSPVLKDRYRFYPFLGVNISDALDAADVIISRAGGSIFEIAAKGKPAVLIPLPRDVVGEHQLKNAYIYQESGAAVVIEQENLLRSVFIRQIEQMVHESGIRDSMSKAARTFAKPEAAKRIADDIMSLTNSYP